MWLELTTVSGWARGVDENLVIYCLWPYPAFHTCMFKTLRCCCQDWHSISISGGLGLGREQANFLSQSLGGGGLLYAHPPPPTPLKTDISFSSFSFYIGVRSRL